MYLNFIKRRFAFNAKRRLSSVNSLHELSASTNTLVVGFRHELSSTQIYPFYFYRDILKNKHGMRFQEINIELLNTKASSPLRGSANVKRIYFQHSFMMSNEDVVKHLELLANTFPQAKIAFLDWFGPLHIRYANSVDPYIDLYIKKQTFTDFSDYNNPTVGDTNLSDYYAKRHQIDLPHMTFSAPPGFENKMRLSPNFYFSPQMVDLFMGDFPADNNRQIDLHARIASKGDAWYQAMRGESVEAVKNLSGLKIAFEGRVKRHKFFSELRSSKVVFSPFGYGEVCWRDYEAYATGALLIKPNMNHLKTSDDSFINDQTYIAVNWDLSDFEEKVNLFLKDKDRREKIARNAFEYHRDLILGAKIPNLIASTFTP